MLPWMSYGFGGLYIFCTICVLVQVLSQTFKDCKCLLHLTWRSVREAVQYLCDPLAITLVVTVAVVVADSNACFVIIELIISR